MLTLLRIGFAALENTTNQVIYANIPLRLKLECFSPLEECIYDEATPEQESYRDK